MRRGEGGVGLGYLVWDIWDGGREVNFWWKEEQVEGEQKE